MADDQDGEREAGMHADSGQRGGPNLYQRICSVMADVEKIDKTGKNAHFGFNFIEQSMVMAALRPKMARAGLVLIPSVEDVGTSGKNVMVTMTFTLFNADDPTDRLSFRWCAEGQDSTDKGIVKAIVQAQKYALMKLFMLSDKDDPDADGPLPERGDRREAVGDSGDGALAPTADRRPPGPRQGPSTQTHAAPAATAVLAPGTAPTANGQQGGARRWAVGGRPATAPGPRREAAGDRETAPLPPTAHRLAPTPAATLDRVAGEFAAAAGTEQAAQRGTVEQAKEALKEACLRVGLPVPLTLREVNALAGRYGVSAVGSSAGMTAAWLDDIRAHLPDVPVGPLDEQHMSETATALGALRATCRATGRAQPQSLEALNTLATEAGMGIVGTWDSVTVGWLEAIGRRLGDRREAVGDRGAGSSLPPTAHRLAPGPEQALAGWIAAAPDKETLEQLATDVARAHEAGTIGDKAAEALLESVDVRGAELDLYGASDAESGQEQQQAGARSKEGAAAAAG